MRKILDATFGLALGLLLSAPAWAAYPGTAPLIVPNGGTGITTSTAHGVILGEGTAAFATSATGATGIPFIGQGASADPIFGTAAVAGGGTGDTTLTQYGVLVGAGTGAVVEVGPGATAGVPLIAGGSSANPSFGTAVVAGGGTGLTTLTAHAVMLGEGTSNVGFVGSGSTADSVVAWAAAGSDPAALSIGNCTGGTNALTYSTSAHTFGCNSISASGTIPTEATVTGSSPFTITATNLLTTVVSMGTPAASTINLPTAVQTAGWRECVKDGTTNFGTYNATLKSPTSGEIDGVAGSTGIVMNQQHEELCTMSDGTNWWIE